jgi:hypothetical protein
MLRHGLRPADKAKEKIMHKVENILQIGFAGRDHAKACESGEEIASCLLKY